MNLIANSAQRKEKLFGRSLAHYIFSIGLIVLLQTEELSRFEAGEKMNLVALVQPFTVQAARFFKLDSKNEDSDEPRRLD